MREILTFITPTIVQKSIIINTIIIIQKSGNVNDYNLFKIIKKKFSNENLYPKSSPTPALSLTRSTCNIICFRVPRTRLSSNTSR